MNAEDMAKADINKKTFSKLPEDETINPVIVGAAKPEMAKIAFIIPIAVPFRSPLMVH